MAYFSVACRAIRRSVLVHFLLPGGVGHTGLRHFLLDAEKNFFVEFFLSLFLSHAAHAVIKTKAIQFNLEQGRYKLNVRKDTEWFMGQAISILTAALSAAAETASFSTVVPKSNVCASGKSAWLFIVEQC
jgi:hypothetical protein